MAMDVPVESGNQSQVRDAAKFAREEEKDRLRREEERKKAQIAADRLRSQQTQQDKR